MFSIVLRDTSIKKYPYQKQDRSGNKPDAFEAEDLYGSSIAD